ncbi:L,D-transpeptidase family protein [Clostridioides difficile]|uniref:L,D-transpeptidase/peptidoglycan binding protein n=1 Tax=Clostridioides difficile TaxID=1496 RepID=A0A9P3WRR4_CLODI|nr:L,D-transpeptidase family protein [Clostridioides difficile]MDC0804899.1 L,D-transpeptidase family protein [Clostridium paraputrificum]AWH78600.1 peptidoglycan-binding protein [Clostridioides difficile]AWH82425.1 peptidoglycan-binding protein [Clostridioides difficile]AXU47513.1 peptidoglycan-binding exported protein [Clostridioides difficile]AXU51173.1 peptidoglycan-binding exported protein [Clostridioides difficile]
MIDGKEVKQESGQKNLKFKIAIVVGVLFVAYIGMAIFFRNHFYFGTTINGVKASGKTVEQVNDLLTSSTNSYTLNLEERNNKKEQIKAKDIDLKFTPDDKVQKIKDSQSAIGWIGGIFKSKEYNNMVNLSYNKDLLEKRFNALSCFDSKNVVEPKSAYPKYDSTKNAYVIVPEVLGNKVKKDDFYKLVQNSINSGNTSISLDESKVYEAPNNTKDSEKLKQAIKTLDKYVGVVVTYDFSDRKETLDGSEINKWLKVDSEKNYDITFDNDAMVEYTRGLSKKYSTFGDSRPFKTATGKDITISGGIYGWLIDKKKEAEALVDVVKAGKNVTREPIYIQKAVSRNRDDIGNTYVEISLSGQHMWFFKNGEMLVSTDVVTGDLARGFATPSGIYPLNYKARNVSLTGQGYSSPVSYWLPFNGNIGIHDATWRNSFGGGIYKSSGSHGCVNTPFSKAKKIYENIEPGTPIILY